MGSSKTVPKGINEAMGFKNQVKTQNRRFVWTPYDYIAPNNETALFNVKLLFML